MAIPSLPVPANLAVTVSDLKTLRQLVDSGQLKTWQAGAVMDVVVNRREAGLLMLDTGKGLIGLPVPADVPLKPGTALQLQVLALAPLQVQLRPAPEPGTTTTTANKLPLPTSAPLLVNLPNNEPGRPTGPLPTPASPILTPAIPVPTPAATDPDPVRELGRQLARVLQPLLSQTNPERLTPLPARLQEWLSRVAPTLAAPSEPQNPNPRAGSLDWPRLTQALLTNWPSSQQASEPEPLETLLRQALFGEPTSTTTSPSARTGNDWLSSIMRLLLAMPSAVATTANATPTTTTTQTSPQPTAAHAAAAPTRTDDKAVAINTAPPLSDELLDELASVLGRQQQHWLNNVQADARQQPLYAELLLRHGERLDPFELTVREDAQGRDNRDPSASPHHVVRLRFDLPGLGICQFLLDLNADDLQLHFYSENADAVSLFNEHLDTLAGILAADAIHLTTVQSHRVDQLPALHELAERGFHVRV